MRNRLNLKNWTPASPRRIAAVYLASTALFISFDCNLAAHAQTVAAENQINLNLPAQDLGRSLTSFADKANLRLIFPYSLVAGKVAPRLAGSYSPEGALSALLAGSGLRYAFTGSGTATISAAGEGADAGEGGATDLAPIVLKHSGDFVNAPYETAGSSSYISDEQIERFRGSSAGDVFKGTPGVIAASNHNGAALDVNIRGEQGQNRVKVAIDGTQQTSTTWRGYIGVDERTYIDPDFIGGISINKGPTGGAEGAGTTGGVVAIRTLNATDIVDEDKEFGARLKVGTSDNAAAPPAGNTYEQRTDAPGFFDLENFSGSAAIATTQENFDFLAAVAKRRSGNYFAGSHGDTTFDFDGRTYPLSFTKPGEEVFNTSEETTSLLLKSTIRWAEDHSLELGYMRFDSNFGESMGSLLFQQDNGFRQVKLSDVRADTYTARYRWNPDDDLFDLRFNLWASNVAQTTRAVASAPDFSQWGYIPADEPRFTETWTYGGDLNNTSRFSTDFGDLTFNYGVSYLLEDMDGEQYCSRTYTNSTCVYLQPSVGTRSMASAFSSAQWEATDWLTFNGTLRYDAYRLEDKAPSSDTGVRGKDGGRLNPTISTTITPIEGLQFYALYAEGVRPPTMREAMGSDANSIPNPNLDAEVSRNWELGVNLNRDGLIFDDDQARLKLAYFRNNYSNYISRVASNAGPGEYVFTFDNIDRFMISGVEVSGKYDVGPIFSEASLTYYTDYAFCPTTSSCGNTAVTYDYATNHIPPKIQTSLTLGARLFDDKLTVGMRILHSGERMAPLTTSDRQRTAVWQPYTVVDAFASYKVNAHMTFDLKGENIFDRYYVDAMNGWMPSPGRTIRASLTAKF